MCFAALSSFGGVESIVDSPEKQLFGWSPWDSSIVEFFLEGEMRLLKKSPFIYLHPHFNVHFVAAAPKEVFLELSQLFTPF